MKNIGDELWASSLLQSVSKTVAHALDVRLAGHSRRGFYTYVRDGEEEAISLVEGHQAEFEARGYRLFAGTTEAVERWRPDVEWGYCIFALPAMSPQDIATFSNVGTHNAPPTPPTPKSIRRAANEM